MKAKHTPGPWEIEYNGPYEQYWVTAPHYDAGPARIISNIADARLIAAAPDLLETLQWLRPFISKDEEGAAMVTQKVDWVQFREWIDRVDATIAKATGEKA